MKKKILSFIMACCMMLGCVGTAAATPAEDVRTPVVLEQGISTRAVSPPTANAPASWYGYDVAHYWTATYYTYSSYWFTTTHEFGLNVLFPEYATQHKLTKQVRAVYIDLKFRKTVHS